MDTKDSVVQAAAAPPPPSAPSAAVTSQSNGNGNGHAHEDAPSNGITADEIALYDRQIRLWGMKAQEKIRSANILLITMKALANEIAKNLVLAGIGAITIVDHETVTEADLGAQFFLSEEDGHLGQNRAVAASTAIQRLNPRVKVSVDTGDIRSKSASFFQPFDIVIATDLDPASLNIVNTATRVHQRAFYAAGTEGLYGFIFADLIEHDYVIEREKGNMPTKVGPETLTRAVVDVRTRREGGRVLETVTKRELYSTWLLASDVALLPAEINKSARRRRAVTPALSCFRALWEFQQLYGGPPRSDSPNHLAQFTVLVHDKHKALSLPSDTLRSDFLRSFLQNVGAEVAPAAAILGGQLAQDVINVLGQSQQPIQNLVVFDGAAMEASMYALHPDGRLGNSLLATAAQGAEALGSGNLAEAQAAALLLVSGVVPPAPEDVAAGPPIILE